LKSVKIWLSCCQTWMATLC